MKLTAVSPVDAELLSWTMRPSTCGVEPPGEGADYALRAARTATN